MEKKAETKEKKPKKQETKKKPDEKEQVRELTDSLQRLQAEFENYKKRVENENQQFLKYAKAELICKLLPILDSFELALKNNESHEKFLKGMEMIYAQFHSILEAEGLRPIKADGKLDPFKHEVLMKQESDKEEDIILEDLQKGYMLNDKVLRHSKVKVSKKAKKKEKQEESKKSSLKE